MQILYPFLTVWRSASLIPGFKAWSPCSVKVFTAPFSLVLFYIISLLFALVISGLEFIMGPFRARIIGGVGICGPSEDETSLCANNVTAATSPRVHQLSLTFTISFTVLQRQKKGLQIQYMDFNYITYIVYLVGDLVYNENIYLICLQPNWLK